MGGGIGCHLGAGACSRVVRVVGGHGSRHGEGGGNTDVTTKVVEVHDDGGDSADVATEMGAVHDNRVSADVACHGAANR